MRPREGGSRGTRQQFLCAWLCAQHHTANTAFDDVGGGTWNSSRPKTSTSSLGVQRDHLARLEQCGSGAIAHLSAPWRQMYRSTSAMKCLKRASAVEPTQFFENHARGRSVEVREATRLPVYLVPLMLSSLFFWRSKPRADFSHSAQRLSSTYHSKFAVALGTKNSR